MIISVYIAFFCIAVVLIVGGLYDWRWITDPPKWLAPFYTQAFFRLLFPRKVVRVISVVLGLAMIGVAIAFIIAPMQR